MSVKAVVTNIARGSLHDGSGVRSVVYFKGCNMRCAWCHNPENFTFSPQILWNDEKCIHCGRCLLVCPEHHIAEGNAHVFQREGCEACGRCAEACPSQALQLCGKEMTPEQVMDEVRHDKVYFQESDGGVTFSGGECLLWPEFLAETAKLCKEEGIPVTIETALNVPWEAAEPLIPLVDIWYVDIKLMDTEKHRKYTGKGNEQILDNLRRLSERSAKICVRVPMIPGVNDDSGNLEPTVSFAWSLHPAVQGVELLRYNTLASSKYRLLGKDFANFAEEPQDNETMKEWCGRLNRLAGADDFVFYTP